MFFRRSKPKHKRVCLKSTKKDIINETDKLVKDLRLLSRRKGNNGTEAIYKHLSLLMEVNNLVLAWLTDIKTPTYLVTSLFLRDSFYLLNQRNVESLHFVTGPEKEGTKVLAQRVGFRLEYQSAISAKGDSEAVRKVLIQLSEDNLRLLGYFHIHPGIGAGSTFPSSTDLALERLLNQGGYEAIGAIFSRDGFIRFFSSKPFNIKICGNGVEKVNENVYCLLKIG